MRPFHPTVRPTVRLLVSRLTVALLLTASLLTVPLAGQGGAASIRPSDLRTWLTYIASDELQGRAVYSTGIGLAAAYVADHLREWGVRPGGDDGSYFQTVRVLGIRSTNRSRLVVTVGDETRTFANGEGIRFPSNVGGSRTVRVDRVEFAGYGVDAPLAGREDYAGRDVAGAAVVWLGARGPKGLGDGYQRIVNGRSRYATDQRGAVAAIGAAAAPPAGAGARGAGGGRGGRAQQIPTPDFTTVQRLDQPLPPTPNGEDALFEFLFSQAEVPYAELKRLADAQEDLPRFSLEGVTMTFEIDAEYEVVRTQYAHNVVGIVDGSDPALRDTYVAIGAHLDHVGYAEGELADDGDAPRRPQAPGRIRQGFEQDRIWNGADDDGSGIVGVMAVARAFAQGPRPPRSLLFVWHTGEERGLLGSRFYADYPTVPLDRIVAQVNVDMIGRNRDDKASEADTVYPVGSDRISSELDGVLRAANAALARPLVLDYELNDPNDLEQIYYRSDHYSYAAKGVPVVFLTTGLHPDYHANTDDVSKIEFDKLARVAGLIHATGLRLASLERPLVRDNLGPRTGRSVRTSQAQ